MKNIGRFTKIKESYDKLLQRRRPGRSRAILKISRNKKDQQGSLGNGTVPRSLPETEQATRKNRWN